MVSVLKIASLLVEDAFRWLLLLFRSAEALRAENLFLRRRLALYIEVLRNPEPPIRAESAQALIDDLIDTAVCSAMSRSAIPLRASHDAVPPLGPQRPSAPVTSSPGTLR